MASSPAKTYAAAAGASPPLTKASNSSNNATSSGKSASSRPAAQTPALITLNIGGVRYTTTYSTLASRGQNFLTTMLHSDLAAKDETGAYFIDRDGQYFAPILTYLRTGAIDFDEKAKSSTSVRALLREARFYMIDRAFINALEDREPPLTDAEVDSLLYQTVHSINDELTRQIRDFLVEAIQAKCAQCRTREEIKFYIFRDKKEETVLLNDHYLPKDFKDNLFIKQFGATFYRNSKHFNFLLSAANRSALIALFLNQLSIRITPVSAISNPVRHDMEAKPRNIVWRFVVDLPNPGSTTSVNGPGGPDVSITQ